MKSKWNVIHEWKINNNCEVKITEAGEMYFFEYYILGQTLTRSSYYASLEEAKKSCEDIVKAIGISAP